MNTTVYKSGGRATVEWLQPMSNHYKLQLPLKYPAFKLPDRDFTQKKNACPFWLTMTCQQIAQLLIPGDKETCF
jgi:hypothetical protein